MTTIENPATEKMNGSSRMTTFTDSPWWIVRPSLAASLAGSFALTYGAYRLAGMTQPPVTVSPRTLATLMQFLSATPTLTTIGALASILAFRPRGRRALQILCILLALASFTGVGLNRMRESGGENGIASMIDRLLDSGSELTSAK